MKKVCILTSAHPAFDVRIFHKEAKTLAKAGYNVSLIAQHDKNQVVDGVKIIALTKPKNRFFRMCIAPREILKLALKQNADIYHFHELELIPVGIIIKLGGKKVIYDVHEDVPKSILSRIWILKILRKPLSVSVHCFEKVAALGFNFIITATPHIKDTFSFHKVIDIENYPIIETTPQIMRKTKKDMYTLICTGSLDKSRGIEEIIRAIELVNPKHKIELILAGRFSEKNFEEECRNLKGWGKTKFLGWLEYKEIIPYLLNADIGLVCFHPEPNHIEALPNKLFEYMAGSLPIIASNFPLWKKIIKGDSCGICVDPLKSEEIAKAIEYLIENPEEAKKMGENGRKAVLGKYNWENESRKLLRVYERL